MEELYFTISEIAKRNGLSAKTVQRIIKEYPEIGVVMQPRKKTLLTYEQAAKVSGLLIKSRQSQKETEPIAELGKNLRQAETETTKENVAVSETETKNDEVAELYRQIAALTERAAKAEGRAEVLEEQVRDLQSQRSEWSDERARLQSDVASVRGLLESSEAKAARAEAQVDLARSEVAAVANAGFFSRGRMAKELYEKLTRLELESGD